MKDEKAREAVIKLAHHLGISAEENYGAIEIGKWSTIDGGNSDKRPISNQEFLEFKKDLSLTINALLSYLGIEIVDGPKKIVKKVAKK